MTSRRDPFFAPGRQPTRRPGQSGSKRDLNRKQRADELARAALGLFLKGGVEPVTIDDVTRAAGVAKGTFYRYFDDKTQLVEALIAPLTAAVRSSMETASSALANARTEAELGRAYVMLASELAQTLLPNAPVVQLYLQESRAPAVGARAPIRKLADEVTLHAIELTRLAHGRALLRDLPPAVTANAVVGAVETLLFRFLEGAALGSPEEASSALISMVLDGLRAPASAKKG